MAEVEYYREWLINCSNDIVPGIEREIQERSPWGETSAMDRLYNSLLMDEKTKFVQAMKDIVADPNSSIPSKIMIIDYAASRAIWDIGPEVERLDRDLPPEPWDYDKLNPPNEEECERIDLRGVVNIFLIERDESRMRAR